MDDLQVRSRRALLTAAAGGAAALAANAALSAGVAKAVDTPLLLNGPNSASSATTLGGTLDGATTLGVTNDSTQAAPTAAVSGYTGAGTGVKGSTHTGTGVDGLADDSGTGVMGASATGAGVIGLVGDWPYTVADTVLTGVYGFAPAGDGTTTYGTGVWGLSADVGVYGNGSTGVIGDGGDTGWGLYGYSKSSYGLYVDGRVKLATRSGRSSVAKGKSSWSKTVSGVSSSCIVIAVLQQAETGAWVRAAVASTNKITVYFNKALPSASVVGWLILN